MRLRSIAYQELNHYTMARMSVCSIRRWKCDRLFNMSLYNGDIYDTLDEMARWSKGNSSPSSAKHPIRYYGMKRCNEGDIVAPVRKNYGKLIGPLYVRSLIQRFGFLYAMSSVHRTVERDEYSGLIQKLTLRIIAMKGDKDNDY